MSISGLPDQPQIAKAFFCPQRPSERLFNPLPKLLFGTLFAPSKEQWRHNIRPIDLTCPEAAEMMKRGRVMLDLPSDWKVRTYLTTHLTSLITDFAALWFEVEHGLEFKHPRGGRMPEEILWLLSGHLQRGEACNYRNYQQYCQLEGLKFLPLLIDHNHFRFFVFRPTIERVQAAIKTFQDVLERLKGGAALPRYAEVILRNVRLDELRRQRFTALMEETRLIKYLAVVYHDLKGPQDAVRFTPD